MTALVFGATLAGQAGTGSVETQDSPELANSGATNTNYAIGAFTGLAGLPEAIADDDDFVDFGAALMAKTSESYDGGVTLTNISANLFFGAGGGGNDTFDVFNSADGIIQGRGGDDTLSLKGNTADATLNGGDGDDALFGRGVTVLILGGDGDDILKPMGVDSTVEGGAGNDTLELLTFGPLTVSLAATGPQTLGGGAGTETLATIENLRTGANHDSLTGSDASNLLDGGLGDDTISAGKGDDTLIGGLGDNVMDGGGGFDWISYAATPSSMTVLLYDNFIIRNGFTDNDTAVGVEGIIGSAFADDLAGDGGRNAIRAGDGGDTVQGKENSDEVSATTASTATRVTT